MTGSSWTIAATFLSCLALTVVVELAVALAVFHVRDARYIAVVALAQVVTNPPLVLATIVAGVAFDSEFAFATMLIVLETAAVVAEGGIYRYAGLSDRPYILSLACNAASFAIGFTTSLVSCVLSSF
ncbi:hypothetical protein [Slackia exigua]|uniref:hypothetical protein n=1 Tax=Slackia exigua TaxID=84109 RepID=UPI0028DBEB29|nr:hypothetical protein [Slackia exigua]